MGWLVAAAGAVLAAAAGMFVRVYHVRAPWWRSREGRHLVAVAVVLGAVGVQEVGAVVCPGWGWWRPLRAGLLLTAAGLLVQRIAMVLHPRYYRVEKGGRSG
ncbi:hypothetical protein JJV70_02090 [Streptomyces sp. JJ66]|uniref:putative phage holin n=1 Tax=Streptomyces sp. JJ66 TaxID=2803843 RepID=UPI001C583B81|nr:hypothetical protein [Streptomyces sp. JJ66]MBW1600911.1 hypothetical protein [Streptomyces sp. JJ66]